MPFFRTNFLPWNVWPILLALSVVACGLNVANTVRDVGQYGGTDLRIRVVGARALIRGLNPYTLSQSADTDLQLRDPDHVQLSRCTYPPTLLLFCAPFSGWSYRDQRKLWALLEWSAFFGSVWLLSRSLHDPAERTWFWIVALGLFGGSSFWRLHVERGQYYVFVVLLLSISYFLQQKLSLRSNITAGFSNGAAIVLRPTAVLTALPGFLRSPRGTAVTSITTALILGLASCLIASPAIWSDFLRLSAQWEQALLTTTDSAASSAVSPSDVLAVNSDSEAQRSLLSPGSQSASVERVQVIDGYRMAIMPGPAASLTFLSLSQSVLKSLQVCPRAEILTIFGKIFCIILLIVICGVSMHPLMNRRSEIQITEFSESRELRLLATRSFEADEIRQRFLVGICLMLTADCFLPIRVEYADILFLIPAALLMPDLLLPENRIPAMATAAAFLSHRLLLLGLPEHLSAATAMLRSFMSMYLLIRLTLFETSARIS